jgi:membrane protease YdiL (CAAX protease family)
MHGAPAEDSRDEPPPLARPVSLSPCDSPLLPRVTLAGYPHVSRRDAALDLALVLGVAIVWPLLSVLAGWWLSNGAVRPPATVELIAAKWIDMAVVVGLCAYLAIRHRLPAAAIGLGERSITRQAGWALGTLLACYGVLLTMGLVIVAVSSLLPALNEDILSRTEYLEMMPTQNVGVAMLLLAPVAIHEEVLFRSLLLGYIWALTGRAWIAVVCSGAVFAVLHYTQGWVGVFQVFGLGIVFGVFYVRSRSLPAVVLAHFAFDFAQLQLLRVLLPYLEKLRPIGA